MKCCVALEKRHLICTFFKTHSTFAECVIIHSNQVSRILYIIKIHVLKGKTNTANVHSHANTRYQILIESFYKRPCTLTCDSNQVSLHIPRHAQHATPSRLHMQAGEHAWIRHYVLRDGHEAASSCLARRSCAGEGEKGEGKHEVASWVMAARETQGALARKGKFEAVPHVSHRACDLGGS